MNQDGVNIAFELMLEEIQSVISELNEEGASYLQNGDYSKLEKIVGTGKELSAFKEKLEKLKFEWNRGFDATTRQRIKSDRIEKRIPFRKKNNRTGIIAIFADGQKIAGDTAARTFVEIINRIGVERVKNLDIHVNRIPLISTFKDEKYGASQYTCGKYYVITHSSTIEKANILNRIISLLNEKIKVEII